MLKQTGVDLRGFFFELILKRKRRITLNSEARFKIKGGRAPPCQQIPGGWQTSMPDPDNSRRGLPHQIMARLQAMKERDHRTKWRNPVWIRDKSPWITIGFRGQRNLWSLIRITNPFVNAMPKQPATYLRIDSDARGITSTSVLAHTDPAGCQSFQIEI